MKRNSSSKNWISVKTLRYALLPIQLLVLIVLWGLPPESAGALQEQSAPQIVERAPHHRVWLHTVQNRLPDGSIQLQTNSWVELRTGLHRWDNGWVETSPRIELFHDGAVVRNLQYQAIFAPNLHSPGAIDLLYPGEERLRGQIVGLAYTEGDKSVLIAEVKDCAAEISGPEDNVLTYRDAFTEFDIAVQYVARRGRFSQNVILNQQLPPPEEYGLTRKATLELLSEFEEFPQLEVRAWQLPDGSIDHDISVGSVHFSPGKAFRAGAEHDKAIRVNKAWNVLSGRNFLIEKVPAARLLEETKHLPPPPPATAGLKRFQADKKLWASRQRGSPELPGTNKAIKPVQMAQLKGESSSGFVLDYELVVGASDFTFKSDTTYHVTGETWFSGNTIIEGGTVIKFTNVLDGCGIVLGWDSTVTCLTAPYRPAVLTSMHDDTVGEILPWSTGTPTPATNASFYLYPCTGTGSELKHIRVSYAYCGIGYDWGTGHHDLRHAQFVKCHTPVWGELVTLYMGNVLLYDSALAIGGADLEAVVEHATIHKCSELTYDNSIFAFTNCLFVQVTNWGNSTITTNTVHCTDDAGVFQTVGAGAHYQAEGSGLRDAGTTNIDANLRQDLLKLSTYPPLVYSNCYFPYSLDLVPRAVRDSDAPDLGYHYDPVDYAVGGTKLTNASITLKPGTVLAVFDPQNGDSYGVVLFNASSFKSEGTPIDPCWIVRYNTVQELATTNWGRNDSAIMSTWFTETTAPSAMFRFTQWSTSAKDSKHFRGYYGNSAPVSFQDCQFLGGEIYLNKPSTYFTNCLFDRVYFQTLNSSGKYADLTMQNNLFRGGYCGLTRLGTSTNVWRFYDNLFDNTTITQRVNAVVIHDYNAYVTNCSRLTNTAANDIILTSTSLDYQAGPLGAYYYPTNGGLLSRLLNSGSVTNAGLVGLYHYTTTTNQSKEANSRLDIGYHFVAVNASGNPVDTDGDTMPDYLEDANGNGQADAGETDWQSYNSPNGLTGNPGLQIFTPLR
jgi:hypothetical protein